MKQGDMPDRKGVDVPEGGWKPHTVYRVLVSVGPTNPLWYALYHVGMMNGGEPGAYSHIWNPTVHRNVRPYRLIVLEELGRLFENEDYECCCPTCDPGGKVYERKKKEYPVKGGE